MHDSARIRYLVAKWLLISGLISLAATLPISIAAWGSPFGVVALFTAYYGVFGIPALVVIGLFNLIALRLGNSAPIRTEHFE